MVTILHLYHPLALYPYIDYLKLTKLKKIGVSADNVVQNMKRKKEKQNNRKREEKRKKENV